VINFFGGVLDAMKARESIFINGGAEIFVELIENGEAEVVNIVLDALININISGTKLFMNY